MFILLIHFCFAVFGSRVFCFFFKKKLKEVEESDRRGLLPPYCGALQSNRIIFMYKNMAGTVSSTMAGDFILFYIFIW